MMTLVTIIEAWEAPYFYIKLKLTNIYPTAKQPGLKIHSTVLILRQIINT